MAKGEIVRAESVVSETKDQVTINSGIIITTIIIISCQHHHHPCLMAPDQRSLSHKQIELTVDAKKHVHLDYGSLNR